MRNLGLVELVDSMNYALDYLAKYLPVEPEKRYLYREKDYREPRIELYFSGKENDITEIPNTVKDEGTSFLSHFLEDSLCENIYSSKSIADINIIPIFAGQINKMCIFYELSDNSRGI